MHKSHRHWRHPVYASQRALHPWLTERGSLTAKLIGSHPRFRVKLLEQGTAMPHHDELQALALPKRIQALAREVLLMSGEVALVYAHSVVPRPALRSGFRRLNRQGSRSLGATLFANPRIRRGPLVFAQIDQRHPLWRSANAAVGELPSRLWARRSCFMLGMARLLVTEVFLPAVLTGPIKKEKTP